MREEAICDGCNGKIPRGQGYLFYSTASIGVPGMLAQVGTLLYCDSCTDDRINEREFSKPAPLSTDVSPDPNDVASSLMRRMVGGMREENIASIAQACKRHGFTIAQAKVKARELAASWWQDEKRGALEAQTFWTANNAMNIHSQTISTQITSETQHLHESGNGPRMRLREILFSFKGRIPRATFWVVWLSTLAVIALFIGFMVSAKVEPHPAVLAVWIPIYITLLWIMLATQVKRYHDTNTSGWMVLIGLIPYAGALIAIIWLGFVKGTDGPNRFGAGPLISRHNLNMRQNPPINR